MERRLKRWEESRFASRLWQKDYTLWSKEPQPELADRLGWLELPRRMEKEVDALRTFADKAKAWGLMSQRKPRLPIAKK